MLPAARWIVVAVVAIACATAPALLHVIPAHDSDITATALAKRIHASAALGWSGEVHAIGSLEVPLTGSTFGGVSRLLGGQTDLRVWWRDQEHWRLDRLRTSGEQDLVRDGAQTMRWTYESSTARFTPYSDVRLPNDSDVVPPVLATRLLSGAKAAELTRLPARRVDGRGAAGLRLVPSDPRTTIARVDVWADEDTGLPLRVNVYDEGGRDRPILTTQLVSLDTDRPSGARTSIQIAGGVRFTRGAALDEAAGANAFAPFALPDEVADLPRRGRPETFRAVGIYGRGPTALVGIPLRSFVTKALYDQLSSNRTAKVTKQRVSLQVGPLSVLLLVGRDVGLLLTGTVTQATLKQATSDMVRGMVRTPMIRTHALTKTYGSVAAVQDLDLDVAEGDVYGFLGANGSGKTTTVRMLLGLVLATSGEAELFGEPMPRSAASVLPRVGALVEGPGAYPHLSGHANLALFDAAGRGGQRGRARRRTRVTEVLEQVGLDPHDDRPVKTYSLGMRQRLGLGGALMRRPPLLVLDEPTNGLDPQGIRDIRELLLQLNREGTTIFLSSHLLAEIEQMCTRVGVLDRGRMVLQEQMSTLHASTGLVRVRTPDVTTAHALLDGRVQHLDAHELVVRTEDPAGLNRELVRAGVRILELTPVRPSLEEIVLAATESSQEGIR